MIFRRSFLPQIFLLLFFSIDWSIESRDLQKIRQIFQRTAFLEKYYSEEKKSMSTTDEQNGISFPGLSIGIVHRICDYLDAQTIVYLMDHVCQRFHSI